MLKGHHSAKKWRSGSGPFRADSDLSTSSAALRKSRGLSANKSFSLKRSDRPFLHDSIQPTCRGILGSNSPNRHEQIHLLRRFLFNNFSVAILCLKIWVNFRTIGNQGWLADEWNTSKADVNNLSSKKAEDVTCARVGSALVLLRLMQRAQ